MTDATDNRVHTRLSSIGNSAATFTATSASGTWSVTSYEPDVFDDLISAFTSLALAMRAWKGTL